MKSKLFHSINKLSTKVLSRASVKEDLEEMAENKHNLETEIVRLGFNDLTELNGEVGASLLVVAAANILNNLSSLDLSQSLKYMTKLQDWMGDPIMSSIAAYLIRIGFTLALAEREVDRLASLERWVVTEQTPPSPDHPTSDPPVQPLGELPEAFEQSDS